MFGDDTKQQRDKKKKLSKAAGIIGIDIAKKTINASKTGYVSPGIHQNSLRAALPRRES